MKKFHEKALATQPVPYEELMLETHMKRRMWLHLDKDRQQ